jgi:transposase-like protein
MVSISGKIGCTAETLQRWCRDEAGRGAGPAAMADDDRTRLKRLEQEVKELRRVNELLGKASAYFAMAELDCHRDDDGVCRRASKGTWDRAESPGTGGRPLFILSACRTPH